MSTNRSNDDLEELGKCLGRLPEPPIPDGLEAKLLAAIPHAAALVASQRWQRRRDRRLLAGGLVAAAALVAILSGLFFWRPTQVDDSHLPQSVQQIVRQPPIQRLPRQIDVDIASSPNSFEWPVQLTVSARAQRLPEELTN